jgi:hypothetical protein
MFFRFGGQELYPMRLPSDDDSFDGVDDDTADEFDSGDDSADEPTIPCPWCREDVYEDAVQCPSCGKYLSAEDAPPVRRPLWIIVTALVCLFVVVRFLIGW